MKNKIIGYITQYDSGNEISSNMSDKIEFIDDAVLLNGINIATWEYNEIIPTEEGMKFDIYKCPHCHRFMFDVKTLVISEPGTDQQYPCQWCIDVFQSQLCACAGYEADKEYGPYFRLFNLGENEIIVEVWDNYDDETGNEIDLQKITIPYSDLGKALLDLLMEHE